MHYSGHGTSQRWITSLKYCCTKFPYTQWRINGVELIPFELYVSHVITYGATDKTV